jgi:hypothetical protein
MNKKDLENYLMYNNFGLIKTEAILNCYDKIKNEFPAYKNKLEMIYNYPAPEYDDINEELEHLKIVMLTTKWDCDYDLTDNQFDFFLNSNYTIEQKEAIIVVMEKSQFLELEEFVKYIEETDHNLSPINILLLGEKFDNLKYMMKLWRKN